MSETQEQQAIIWATEEDIAKVIAGEEVNISLKGWIDEELEKIHDDFIKNSIGAVFVYFLKLIIFIFALIGAWKIFLYIYF
ncbi:MAG: hypothetical protein OES84_00200 [Kiritimatiellaceae bacterium]|nr:hypothetical protein [Kiritimatiellaceae bacterium]